ncbi:hypothetical protein ACJX0J_036228 [Zea mays]
MTLVTQHWKDHVRNFRNTQQTLENKDHIGNYSKNVKFIHVFVGHTFVKNTTPNGFKQSYYTGVLLVEYHMPLWSSKITTLWCLDLPVLTESKFVVKVRIKRSQRPSQSRINKRDLCHAYIKEICSNASHLSTCLYINKL